MPRGEPFEQRAQRRGGRGFAGRRAGVDDEVGGGGILVPAIRQAVAKRAAALRAQVVTGLAEAVGRGALRERAPAQLARGHDGAVQARIDTAGGELGHHCGLAPRRVRHDDHRLARGGKPLEAVRRRGEDLAAVVQHAPCVDQKRVIAVRNRCQSLQLLHAMDIPSPAGAGISLAAPAGHLHRPIRMMIMKPPRWQASR